MEAESHTIFEDLKIGSADIAFVRTADQQSLTDYEIIPVQTDHLAVYMAHDHPFAQ